MRRASFVVVLACLTLPGVARADTVSFSAVGAAQGWTVPANVTSATFDLSGAQGGGTSGLPGGLGARVRARIPVTPGETLVIFVGGTAGRADTGFNGGGKGGNGQFPGSSPNSRGFGGGGATDVRRGGTGLANRLMVAAGGGGSSQSRPGGASGGAAASPWGGALGTTSAGGAGGTCSGCGGGSTGALGTGGAGQESGFVGGGGGGGGLFGGGGGTGGTDGTNNGGGGGGSSQVAPAGVIVSEASLENGVRSGAGAATVTFTPTPASSVVGGGGGGGSATADTVKPVLGGLTFSRTTFAAASSGASISATRKRKKPLVGTRVSFSVSEPGSVRFTVQRKTTGRKVGKRCVAPKRSNRKKKRCTRWKSVRGTFTFSGKAGRNTFTFRGRMGGKALSRGSYRLIGVATDGARNASASVNRSFRIVK